MSIRFFKKKLTVAKKSKKFKNRSQDIKKNIMLRVAFLIKSQIFIYLLFAKFKGKILTFKEKTQKLRRFKRIFPCLRNLNDVKTKGLT